MPRFCPLLQPYNNKSGQSSPSGPDRMYFLSFLSVHSHCFSLCFCKSDTWLLRLPFVHDSRYPITLPFSSVEVFFPLYTADSVVYAASHRAQNLRCCPIVQIRYPDRRLTERFCMDHAICTHFRYLCIAAPPFHRVTTVFRQNTDTVSQSCFILFSSGRTMAL